MRNDPKEDVFLEDSDYNKLANSIEDSDKFLSEVKTIKLNEKTVNKEIEDEQFLIEYLQKELYKPNKSANIDQTFVNPESDGSIVPLEEGILKTYEKYVKGNENSSGYDDMKMIQFSNRLDVLRNAGKVVDVSKEQNYIIKLKELEQLKKLRIAKLKQLDTKIDNISKIANVSLKEK